MPRWGQRLAGHVVLALCFLGLLTTWASATARYGGPDEPAHVLRAASVARGEWTGSAVPGLVAGFRSVTVPAALATGDPRCFRHDRRLPAACAVADPDARGDRVAATSSGTYPPWYYVAVGLAVRLVGDPVQVQWYRLAAAALCSIVLVGCFIRAHRTALPAVAIMAAIAPSMWFLFGVVNPNSLEIALALLAWIGVEHVRRIVSASDVPSVSAMWWVGGPLGLAILIRPIAFVAATTVAVTLVVVLWRRALLRRAHWFAVSAAPACAVLASLVWSLWSGTTVADDRVAAPTSIASRLHDAVVGTSDTVHELAGSLGWLEFTAPWPAVVLWWATVAWTGIGAWRARGRLRTAWIVVATSVVIVPILFETVTAGRIGFIWQGRYSLPTGLGLVIIGSADRGRRGSAWLAPARMAAAAVAEIATFWWVLRRYTVGTNGSWWFAEAGWHPQIPPLLLLSANAVLVVWLFVMANSVDEAAVHDETRFREGSGPAGGIETC